MDMRTFTHTVTYYKHKVVNNADVWERKVLKHVFVRPDSIVSMDSDGKVKVIDTVNVNIPLRGHEGLQFDMDDLDVIAVGQMSGELTAANFETFLQRPEVVSVSHVNDYTDVRHCPHWEVVCTCK